MDKAESRPSSDEKSSTVHTPQTPAPKKGGFFSRKKNAESSENEKVDEATSTDATPVEPEIVPVSFTQLFRCSLPIDFRYRYSG